jgi:hypothetical protein
MINIYKTQTKWAASRMPVFLFKVYFQIAKFRVYPTYKSKFSLLIVDIVRKKH